MNDHYTDSISSRDDKNDKETTTQLNDYNKIGKKRKRKGGKVREGRKEVRRQGGKKEGRKEGREKEIETEYLYTCFVLKIQQPCDLPILLLGKHLKEMSTHMLQDLCTRVFIATLFLICSVDK